MVSVVREKNKWGKVLTRLVKTVKRIRASDRLNQIGDANFPNSNVRDDQNNQESFNYAESVNIDLGSQNNSKSSPKCSESSINNLKFIMKKNSMIFLPMNQKQIEELEAKSTWSNLKGKSFTYFDGRNKSKESHPRNSDKEVDSPVIFQSQPPAKAPRRRIKSESLKEDIISSPRKGIPERGIINDIKNLVFV